MIRLLKAVGRNISVREKILKERESRLIRNENNLPTKTSNMNRIRNIGTIAHIDAGKTTLTERLLYFSGVIKNLGEVHHGTALMDYLEEERERGITITSASISFFWKNFQINLIDTPGHADFNFEVERSLRVLDGALVIFDGIKGIEAQTEIVWKQANKYNIPKVCLINKLDRFGCDFKQIITSIEDRFNIKCLPIFVPIFKNEDFVGLVDILNQQFHSWNFEKEENKFTTVDLDLEKNNEITKEVYVRYLENVVESVSDLDGKILEEYFNKDPLNLDKEFVSRIKNLLKTIIQNNPNKYSLAIPISALKNKGVIQVLDTVLEFLPCPKQLLKNDKTPFLFCFKSVEDEIHGKLVFARIFNGNIKLNSVLKNFRNSEYITITNIFRVRVNEFEKIEDASIGDIVAIQSQNSILENGDNLFEENNETKSYLMKGFEYVEPLYFVSLEFDSDKDKILFQNVITKYVANDPSLKYENNFETGQIILKGLGELHLEIVLTQIKKEKKINIKIGKTLVAFKETFSGCIQEKITIERTINKKFKYLEIVAEVENVDFVEGEDELKEISVDIDLWRDNIKIKKLFDEFCHIQEIQYKKKQGETDKEEESTKNSHDQITFKKIENPVPMEVHKSNHTFKNNFVADLYLLDCLSFERLYQLKKYIENTFKMGSITFSPLVNTKVTIKNGFFNPKFIDDIIIKLITNEIYQKFMSKNNLILLEPFLRVFLITNTVYTNLIINNAVQNRSGKIGIIESENKMTKIELFIPLLNTNNYTNFLRSSTRGEIEINMSNAGYYRVSNDRVNKILENLQNK